MQTSCSCKFSKIYLVRANFRKFLFFVQIFENFSSLKIVRIPFTNTKLTSLLFTQTSRNTVLEIETQFFECLALVNISVGPNSLPHTHTRARKVRGITFGEFSKVRQSKLPGKLKLSVRPPGNLRESLSIFRIILLMLYSHGYSLP